MRKIREELKYTTRLFKEENRKGKKMTGDLLITIGILGTIAAGATLYFLNRGKEEIPTTNQSTTTPPTTTSSQTTPSPNQSTTTPSTTATTTPNQTMPTDNQPPIIEKLEFNDRVEKGQLQSISIYVKENNPMEYATLIINGTEIKVPLKEFKEGTAYYSLSFDPGNYLHREGKVFGQIILVDKYGNSISQNLEFLVNLEAPRIENVRVERLDLGKYQIIANIIDENLQNVYLVVNESKIPLSKYNEEFNTLLETLKDLNFVLYAEDKYSMTSSYKGKIEFSKDNPNVAYALGKGLDVKYISIIAPLDNDRLQDANEKQFVDLIIENNKLLTIPTYFQYLNERASDGRITDDEIIYTYNFSVLVKELYDLITNIQYYRNPIKTIDYSSNLGLRMGFDKELAKNATIKAIGYYGIAVIERELPEEFQAISLLTRATQIDKYGDKLLDFSPIVFKSVDGNSFVLIPDVGRETWMLAKHMKLISDSGFDILKHPEMFEGLNGKIIANAYSIFDAKYGINYIEQTLNGRTLKPTDQDVWDLIMLQWNLYSNKAPQPGGENKLYNRDFPWYDSDKLDVLYQDPNTRRQALLFLFHIDNGTFDMEKVKTVVGIEGAKTALIQPEREYETISKLYPNGKVKHQIWGNVPAWWYYYDFIEDRGVNRLENTHLQYVGFKPLELWNIMTSDPENVWNKIKDLNGVDQYITKNWKYWDLVKFAMGYERWRSSYIHHWGAEIFGINYLIPQTLKAFGFPAYWVRIEPTPEGAANYEWVVSLPDYIANKLKSEFNDKIAIGPANGFGLYLCKEGMIKDGISEIFGFSGGTALLADKQPSAGLGSNFKFYLFRK